MSEIEDFVPEPEAPEAPATPATPPPPTVAALDHVIDGDDIDEDYRGKPIKEILRVAKQHKEEAKRAYNVGSDNNALRSRAEMAEAMLKFVQGQQSQRQPAYNPQETVQAFINNPNAVLRQAAQNELEPITKELQSLKQESYFSRAELAREKARQSAGVDEATWELLAKPLASIIHASNGDPSTAKSWSEAFDGSFKAVASKISAKTQIASQGQPPVGQARSTAAQRTGPTLSARNERDLVEMASVFDIKKGTPQWDKLVKEIQGDPTAMGVWNE